MDDHALRAQKGMGERLFYGTMEEQIEAARTSVRRWWWEYLRLSQDYWFLCETCKYGEPKTTDKKLARVFRDFGNVHNVKFEDWWRSRGSKVFEERRDFPKVRQVAPGQIATTEADPEKIFLEIPFKLTRATVLAQVSRILEQYAGQRPKNKLDMTSSDYPISPITIKLEAVIQPAHEVYCLHRELIEKPKALARLGNKHDSSALQVDANLFRIGKVYGLSPDNADLRGEPEAITRKTVAMRREVRRVLDRALILIRHVEAGQFPPLNSKISAPKKARFTYEQMEQYAAIEHKWWALDLRSTLSENKIDNALRIHYSGA